jgi:hypothetical protein
MLISRRRAMCDYSLHNVPSRPAQTGDKIITTSFRSTPTRGFSPVGNPNLAVCLVPGTELAFEQEIEYDGFLTFLRRRKAGGKLARFRQINVDQPNVHHDALELPNGKIVLLTNLTPGQRATVLQLPASAGKFEVEEIEQPKEALEIR